RPRHTASPRGSDRTYLSRSGANDRRCVLIGLFCGELGRRAVASGPTPPVVTGPASAAGTGWQAVGVSGGECFGYVVYGGSDQFAVAVGGEQVEVFPGQLQVFVRLQWLRQAAVVVGE